MAELSKAGNSNCRGQGKTDRRYTLNEGVFDEDVLDQEDGTRMRDASGRDFLNRFRVCVVRLEKGGVSKEFSLPVYEMPIGRFAPGHPVLLIGRTLLNQGTLTYDGPKQKWTLSFADEDRDTTL